MAIYLVWDVQIQIALLIIKNIIVPTEYFDFVDIFLKKLAVKFSKYFDINKHAIDLE